MPTVTDFVNVSGVPTNGITVALYKESDMSLLGTAVTGASAGVTWPTGVTDISYSNGDHTVVSPGGWRRLSIQYALPTTGKYYVEMDITSQPMIGLYAGAGNAGEYLAQSGDACSVGDGTRVSGVFAHLSGSLGGLSNIALCADMDAGRLYVYRNGSLEVTFSFTANMSGLYFAGSPYTGCSITVKDAPTSVISGYTYITTAPAVSTGEYSITTAHTGLAFLVFKSNTAATPPTFTGAENHGISRIYIT